MKIPTTLQTSLISIPDDDNDGNQEEALSSTPITPPPTTRYSLPFLGKEYHEPLVAASATGRLRRESLAETLYCFSQQDLSESFLETPVHETSCLAVRNDNDDLDNTHHQDEHEATTFLKKSALNINPIMAFTKEASKESDDSNNNNSNQYQSMASLEARVKELEQKLALEASKNEAASQHITSLEAELVSTRLRNAKLEAEGWACSAQVLALKEKLVFQEFKLMSKSERV
ncbi:hypothetical protein BDR26DRAFT_863727 [Obelidium mucronatum]|nr:hypothetical protein BDR26DRAFT_863727 [Obelidium mucronatum]